MNEGRITILGISIQDEGLELIVSDDADRRQGIAVAHSYFVDFAGEQFGSRAKDAIAEIQELAEDVHYGWRRAPKEKQ